MIPVADDRMFVVPRSVPSLDGDDVAFFVMQVSGEIQGHADGGEHLGRDFAIGGGHGGGHFRLCLLHFRLRGYLLGILLREIGSHATEDHRKDEKGDDDDEETHYRHNPALGIDPILVCQQ